MYYMIKAAASSGAQFEDMELAPTDLVTTPTTDTPTLTQTSSTADPQAVINHLQQKMSILAMQHILVCQKQTSKLSKANLAIQHFQSQLNSTTTSQGSSTANSHEFPTIAETTNSNNTQFPNAPWHNQAKLDSMKQSLTRHKDLVVLNEKLPLHISSNAVRPIKVSSTSTFLRKQESLLALSARCFAVWALTMPARHTTAVLIHNDFESDFVVDLLQKHRISHDENFNLNSGSILEDPKLEDLSDTERDKFVRNQQVKRLESAVQHIRTPAKYAAARYFYEKNYITKKFYDYSLALNRYPQIGKVVFNNQIPATSPTPLPDGANQMALEDNDILLLADAAIGSPQQ
ncbi:hypothetical protein HMPREF1544_07915 [Mucor circinelloides 1006PhL]|uniref:Uncharacterized protein n=1 Tax=Mucor circinelloides f. circinelloides (strain 1006PhL) TaxID=1220926 RepID=S2J590_MUCC1|nr:hypothetical protein HMPREF1544_07915 [Mucor circinelloides 1006PhL]